MGCAFGRASDAYDAVEGPGKTIVGLARRAQKLLTRFIRAREFVRVWGAGLMEIWAELIPTSNYRAAA